MVLNSEQIKEIVLQRFPFLMLDRVLELEPGQSIKALKNITANEIFFLGHFPEMAVMPGALIIEAMGQAAGVLVAYSKGIKDFKNDPMLLGAVNKARFITPIIPGDQMIIELEVVKLISRAGIIKGSVRVDDKVAATAELVFSAAQLKSPDEVTT